MAPPLGDEYCMRATRTAANDSIDRYSTQTGVGSEESSLWDPRYRVIIDRSSRSELPDVIEDEFEKDEKNLSVKKKMKKIRGAIFAPSVGTKFKCERGA